MYSRVAPGRREVRAAVDLRGGGSGTAHPAGANSLNNEDDDHDVEADEIQL